MTRRPGIVWAAAFVCLGTVAGCGPETEDLGFGASERRAADLVGKPCPPPTQDEGHGRCVLDEDVVLTETIVLGAGMTLHCRHGATMTPADRGHLDVLGDAEEGYEPSTPDLGIFVIGGEGTKVHGCTLDGFEFGIVAVDDKASGKGHQGVKIVNNDITSQVHAVMVVRSDDALVAGNTLETTSGSGLVVVVHGDADRNEVVDNDLTGSANAITGANRVEFTRPIAQPGGTAIGTMSVTRRVVDGVVVVEPTFSTMANFAPYTANGVLVAAGNGNNLATIVVGEHVSQGFILLGAAEDNVVAGNVLDLPGPDSRGVRLRAWSVRTTVQGNVVVDAAAGVQLGEPVFADVLVPGTCSGLGTRRCTTAVHCNLPMDGLDGVGTCEGATVIPTMDISSHHTWVDGNEFSGLRVATGGAGVFDSGSVGTVVTGNTISGATLGMQIGGASLADAVVEGNIVVGMKSGIVLAQSGATQFKAEVSGNDFDGSTVAAAGVAGAWTLDADLAGNYWGHAEAPCFRASDAQSAKIVDSAPSCTPVAVAP